MATKHLPCDTRADQAARVADCLERYPNQTAKEIDAWADTGSITKVLSEMPSLGYGLQRGWREVACVGGTHTRMVRTFTLIYRPKNGPQLDLFGTQ